MGLEKVLVLNIVYSQCLKNGKNAVDKGKVFGALLTDLSKALDCLPHELSYSYPTATTTNNNNLRFKIA